MLLAPTATPATWSPLPLNGAAFTGSNNRNYFNLLTGDFVINSAGFATRTFGGILGKAVAPNDVWGVHVPFNAAFMVTPSSVTGNGAGTNVSTSSISNGNPWGCRISVTALAAGVVEYSAYVRATI